MTKVLVRVTLRYHDGSTMFVAGETDCAAWALLQMDTVAHAVAAGQNYDRKEFSFQWHATPPAPKAADLQNIVHERINDPNAPICVECGTRATLHRSPGHESYQCDECGVDVPRDQQSTANDHGGDTR